jgi:hypothetical protein
VIDHSCGHHFNITKFNVSLDFNQFLNSVDQLEDAKCIIIDSRHPSKYIETDLIIDKPEIIPLERGCRQLKATLKVPPAYIKLARYSTKLVVALRVTLDKNKNHYFPYSFKDNTPRYLAARFYLHSTYSDGIAKEADRKLVFDTFENLKNDKIW